MIEFEKYENEKGEIAVLISRDYGAGWSTSAPDDYDDYRDFLLMDKRLVQMAINKESAEQVERFLESLTLEPFFMAGWSDVVIEWVPKGTAFYVDVYDGFETLLRIDDIKVVA